MMRSGDGALPPMGDSDNGYALSPCLQFVATGGERAPGLTSFHASGYSILHGQHQERLLFDHGELGMAPATRTVMPMPCPCSWRSERANS